MTRNQLAAVSNATEARKAKEAERANRAAEGIKTRQTRNEEKRVDEDIRHNKRMEAIGIARAVTDPIASVLGSGMGLGGKLGSAAITAAKRPNDPEWYNGSKELFNSAVRLPTKLPLVKPFPLTSGGTAATNFDIGTVMGLDYIPTFGKAHDNDLTALTTAADKVYAFVRHANAGSANYDPADLMIYILSMDSILTQLARIRRVLRIAKFWPNLNPKIAYALIKAANPYFTDTNINSIMKNLAMYETRLHLDVSRLSAFMVPAILPLFQRHVFLESSVFTDANAQTNNQYYVFRSVLYRKYGIRTKADAFQGGYLASGHSIETSLQSVFETLELIINDTIKQEDFGIIGGDLLKAYGSSKLIQWSAFEDLGPIVPVYSMEILEQIANADVLGVDPETVAGTDIYQENGRLVTGAYNELTPTKRTISGSTMKHVATVDSSNVFFTKNVSVMTGHADPTPDDIMANTRLQCTYTMQGRGDHSALVVDALNYGSEVVADVSIWYIGDESATEGPLHYNEVQIGYQDTSPYGGKLGDYAKFFGLLSQFDWAPKLLGCVKYSYDSGTKVFTLEDLQYYQPDLENPYLIESGALANLHYTALVCELGAAGQLVTAAY